MSTCKFLHVISCVVICLSVATLTVSKPKPIMVTFGTSKGPIIPRSAYPTHPTTPRADTPSKPAPIYEVPEDVPNPSTYKPPIPHQYRTKLLAVKPSPNLILGTPLDVKYTPSVEKFDVYQKTQQNQAAEGRSYAGPNLFEKQPYEYDLMAQKTFLTPSVSYIKPQVYNNKLNTVPEIGIVYSSGVRYYVPQIYYIISAEEANQPEQHENSVYDKDDRKYFYKT